MHDFKKIVRLGTSRTYGGRSFSTFCKIEFEGGTLSISGVEGPLPSGNAVGACGQIDMHMDADYVRSMTPAPGWTHTKITKFLTIWKAWHLNNMKAGTPAQTAELKKHTFPGYPASHYYWASKVLADAGLNPDNGYKYGSAWLTVEVPKDVLSWLTALPDTDKQPAWV